jgi:hypothetical protein
MRIGAVAAALAVCLAGGLARAQSVAQSAQCDVPVIHALHNGDDGRAPTIDPAINRLKPYLEKAPFTAWRDFKLLDRKDLNIPEGGDATFVLPNGRQATLSFLRHQTDTRDHRMRLRLSIDDNQKKARMLDTTFVLDEGGVVLHVGQKHDGGLLIVGVSCKTHD